MLLPGALRPQMLINIHIKECIEAHAPTLTDYSASLYLNNKTEQIMYVNVLSSELIFFFFFFFFFFCSHSRKMGVSGPGMETELQLQPAPQLWQRWILKLLCWPRIEPTSL